MEITPKRASNLLNDETKIAASKEFKTFVTENTPKNVSIYSLLFNGSDNTSVADKLVSKFKAVLKKSAVVK